jgi:hypothetical protein
MLLLIWKYAFSIKPYSSCNSRIYLSQCQKDFGATFEKKRGGGKEEKRGKSEKREVAKRTSVILGEKGLPEEPS